MMAGTDPTLAPMSVDGIPSPSMRQPRAAVNNSVLEAVIGLTNLGGTPTSPSASKISRSPSMDSEEEEVLPQSRAAPNDAARVSRPFDAKAHARSANRTMIAPASTLSKSKALEPEIAEIVATQAASRPEASAMMLPALTHSPDPYLTNVLLSSSDRLASRMAARRSNLDQPPTWSSQMLPSLTSFGTQRLPFHFHSDDASLSTAAGLHPSTSERLAALGRASAFGARLPDPPYAPLPLPTQRRTSPALSNKNFPETLYAVLSSQEHAHIIAWLPHGRGFIIHDKKRFGDEILPKYFDGAKFTSFTRRLKRWNFERVPRGPELGAYYNKHIIRGRLDLVQKMRYRAGGQFDEGKKKGKESGEESEGESEEDESSKERTDGEVESMGRGKSTNEETRAQTSSPTPIGQQEGFKTPPNQIMAEVESRKKKTIDVANPQELPLTLPKRTKAIKEAISRPSSGASGMLRNVPSTANTKSSSFPRGHRKRTTTRLNTSNQQLLAELQRELVLAHAVSKSIANGGLLGHAGTRLRSVAASHLPGHPSAAERMFSAECTKRALETEQALELAALHRRHTANTHSINPMASNFLVPSKAEEAIATSMHEVRSRMEMSSKCVFPRSNSHLGHGSSDHLQGEPQHMPLPIGCSPFANFSRSEVQRAAGAHPGDGRRTVVMSKEEEEEFTKYLLLKRSAF